MQTKRLARCVRKTLETDVCVELVLDGKGLYTVSTGIGFFDHMLELFLKHSMIDGTIQVNGDILVDSHHTIEDTGIALGKAIGEALGDKAGITRYGTSFVPMDEALCRACVDISGRPYVVFDAEFPSEMAGQMQTDMVEEFFRAVAHGAMITLHISLLYGRNSHHMIEAAFKAVGRCLRQAMQIDPRQTGVPSTKGVL
ncbi:MAG: imidazoleglycerol-phosphate dehydratase HisB [Christensenellales bacterium]|jgi:imidazoleglycerol-phosphate dehydratase